MAMGKRSLYRFAKLSTLPFLTFEAKNKARYTKKDHLELLINASLVNGFAEGVSNALNEVKKVPNGDTLLACLKNQDRGRLVEQFNRIVDRNVKLLKANGSFNRPLPIAIDWQDVVYYGKTAEMVLTIPFKKGSGCAYEFLTASVVADNCRITVAVMPIDSKKGKLRLVRPVIDRMKQMGIRIRCLMFDRGFMSNELLKYLEDNNIKYIMHLPVTKKIRGTRSGTRKRYMTNSHRDYRNNLSYDIACVYDKSRRLKYFFATNMAYRPEHILELYKSRWGVETSYRMHNQFLIRTTSKNYTLRLFYYLFACLMYNVWVVWNSKASRHMTVVQLKICLVVEIVLGKKNIIYT